ncbi:5'-nucleotidase C-terminal domain-containing protein [Bacillus carboniphilus]|uniref:5'-nucleotidase C-terminal domain-containing protein n=1 Tax=Bacillus carboniphilus TaxID=86663 RepID=A0ABY9JUN1_9BACI|nr:5'-nucleotidase C-terminal domain-containing protein [Bacillus carboniphilus]WLR41375.1 5'-nucleotidase C-terminal domain-containing protein [Bacillus carboniphilus]
MKKINRKRISILLVGLLVLNMLNLGAFSQVFAANKFVETFDNLTSIANNTYEDGSFEGENGITWTYVQSRDESDDPIDGDGVMFGKTNSSLSTTLSEGIGSFSVDLKKGFTSNSTRKIDLYINGELKASSVEFTDDEVYNFTVENINTPGEVEIKLVNASSSGKQVVLDNITWTSYEGEVTQASTVKASATGEVKEGTEVTLSTSTDDATIYYTTDGTQPTAESTLYEKPIAITKAMTIKAIAIKDGLDHSEIASFDYTIKAPLEVTDIADVRQLAKDSEAKIEGVVTASFEISGQTNLYVQDDTAAIVVRGNISANIGDRISAEGKVSDFYGMAQLYVDQITIEETDGEVNQKAQVITSSDFNENVEAELVKVENFTINSVDKHGNYTATDAQGTFKLVTQNDVSLSVGKKYDSITGVIDYNYSEYKLTPRTADDIELYPLAVYASSESGSIVKGSEITLETPAENGVIYYTLDGSEPTSEQGTKYSSPIKISEDTTVKAIVEIDGETSEVATYTYEVIESLDGVAIHDIQGARHISLYDGQAVTGVKGIVTHVKGTSGFYMESAEADDNEKTSEGIYVYMKDSNVKVGDLVSVSGEVTEYREDGYEGAPDLLTTQIKGSKVTVEASGQTLPDPVVIGKDRTPPGKIIDNDAFANFDPEEDAIDFYESLEGMRIVLEDAVSVGHPKYGDLPVVIEDTVDAYRTEAGGVLITEDDYNPERIMVMLPDEDVDIKTGDQFDGKITGVVTYDYSNFKVIPTEEMPEVISSDLEQPTTSIEKDEDKLTIASYNIENFSADTSDEKAEKLAKSMINNLKQPDIIGLIEVQDNNGPTDDGTTDASESYKKLIAAIEKAGGPTYKFTDIAPADKDDGGQPGGNIRVGYIYNPDRVSLVEKEAGDATTSVGYDENGLTVNPGRIDPTNAAFKNSRKSLAAEFEFNGEEVIVIANHLNSKRGDGALYGSEQPVVLGSEPSRVAKAEIINGFIDDVMEVNPSANVVVLGDMNDFEFSAPLEALKDNELTNMIEELPKEERYTYNYQGNNQVLDHILVSNQMAKDTEIDIVNINSDFTENLGAASDHDPVLIQTDLHTKNITLLHTNDTHSKVWDDKYAGMGFAKIATLVEQYEQENPNTLMLDAGDTFHGTSFSTLVEGTSIVEIMNEIGYDAMAAGNHDFNYGYDRLLELAGLTEFPVLSANVVYEETGERLLQPYTIEEVDGVKLGIFGLTTPETAYKTHPANVEGIEFLDPVEVANEMVAELEKQNVDTIIALTHLGTDASSTDTSIKVANEAPGIDLIVDGHSHTVDNTDEHGNGTLIVSAGEYTENLGVVNLTYEDGKLVSKEAETITKQQAETDGIEEDPEVKALIDGIDAEHEEILSEVIGSTDVVLDGEREQVRAGETNLGNLITDAMLAETGADVALMNGGGIRASIDQGEITKGEVVTVLPFGNYIQTIEVTGQTLLDALEHGTSSYPEVKGAFPHVAGITFAIDTEQPAGERVHSVMIDGKALELEATYTLATNDFLAAGGDDYSMFAGSTVTGEFAALDEALIEYIAAHTPVSPAVEGRIIEEKFVDKTEITILHTNDTHSKVWDDKYAGMGFAKIATLVEQYEQANPNTLMLDAGDTFHGTSFSTLVEGTSIVEIMNEIGYDAMAAGNHDFNYGYDRLLELAGLTEFPVLSANVVYEENQERLLQPYTIQEVDGVKLGIFGLTTPETAYKTHPANVKGIEFLDPVVVANEMVAELEKQNVDTIIALTHLGTDASSTDTSIKVAKEAPGIDLIVDGHSHTVDNTDEHGNGTLIVSAGEYTENLGVVNLTYEDGKLVSKEAETITKQQAETDGIEEDPEVKALIDKIDAEHEEKLSEVIGSTDVVLDGEREQVRAGETNLGNLITDAMLAETGADVALMNGGGIRASIDQGEITKGEVITVLPFGNYIQTIEVTGQTLLDALEHGTSSYPEVKGAFPHVAGMSFAIDTEQPAGERVHSVMIGGKALDLEATYTLATNDFLAAGGDDYSMFAGSTVTGEFAALDEALIEYIAAHTPVSPAVEGRIIEAAFTDGTDNGTDDGTDNGTDDGTDNGTDDGTDNGTDDGTDNGTDDGTDNGTDNSSDNGTDNSSDNKSDSSSSDKSTDKKEELPLTATNYYQWLLIGLIIVVAGSAGLLYQRKKQVR